MPESLTFLMGKYPAALPGELRYCPNHMWCRPGAGRRPRVRLHRLRRPPDAGRVLPRLAGRPRRRGHAQAADRPHRDVEGRRPTCSPRSPARIVRFNAGAAEGPVRRSTSTATAAGWLFEMDGDPAGTLDAAEYHALPGRQLGEDAAADQGTDEQDRRRRVIAEPAPLEPPHPQPWPDRLTVVLSQAQGKHPAKRALEESIVAALIMEPGLDVSVVPYLYDLGPDHTGRLFLESVTRRHGGAELAVPAGRVLAARPRRHQGPLRRDAAQAAGATRTRTKPRRRRPRSRRGIGPAGECRTGTSTASTCATSTSPTPYVEEVRRIAAECRDRREAEGARRPRPTPRSCNSGFADEAAATPRWRRSRPEAAARAGRPALVSGDRLQPLHELHGVHRLLPVRRLRRRLARPHPGREPGQLQEGLPGVQPGLPGAGDHVPRLQDAGHRRGGPGAVSGLKIDLTKLFGGDGRRAVDGRAGARPRAGRTTAATRSA